MIVIISYFLIGNNGKLHTHTVGLELTTSPSLPLVQEKEVLAEL